jgi:hypothetical protein
MRQGGYRRLRTARGRLGYYCSYMSVPLLVLALMFLSAAWAKAGRRLLRPAFPSER